MDQAKESQRSRRVSLHPSWAYLKRLGVPGQVWDFSDDTPTDTDQVDIFEYDPELNGVLTIERDLAHDDEAVLLPFVWAGAAPNGLGEFSRDTRVVVPVCPNIIVDIPVVVDGLDLHPPTELRRGARIL